MYGFDRYQYGFCKSSSTLSATTDCYVSSKMEKEIFVLAVYIDLRKALDVIDHSVLLARSLSYKMLINIRTK